MPSERNCRNESGKAYLFNIAFAFYLVSASIGQAAQIIVGHLAGAKDEDGARRTGFRAFKLAIIVTASVSLVGILCRYFLVSRFTDNPDVIQIASTLLIVNHFLELRRTTNLTIIPACAVPVTSPSRRPGLFFQTG
ncbi:MAG: hypothetical protein IJ174_01695 [Clostridia bacterium]|nr:hypothetical protein [Clostridia bacterium]